VTREASHRVANGARAALPLAMKNLPIAKLCTLTMALVALLGIAGCSADTTDDDEGSADEGEATSSAVSNLTPCPPCPSASCVGPICIGVRKGKVGCKVGAPPTSKKSTVDPSAYIYSSTCTEWWDQTSGEEQSFSRTCTQKSTKGIDEVTLCTPITKTSAQLVTTVYATAAVKRTRGEVQTNYVVPTETVTPWSAWKKQ
jgi:hypothetical protein